MIPKIRQTDIEGKRKGAAQRVIVHMGREHASREKKINYGKFFDFCAEKCVYN